MRSKKKDFFYLNWINRNILKNFGTFLARRKTGWTLFAQALSRSPASSAQAHELSMGLE